MRDSMAAKQKTKKPRPITAQEKKLADLTLAGVSGVDAASIAYSPSNTDSAKSIASEVLQRPTVRAYLEEASFEAAGIVMKHARGARSEMVSLMAARDVLDRTGYKAIEPEREKLEGNTYNFIFSAETQEKVREIEAAIKARILGHVEPAA